MLRNRVELRAQRRADVVHLRRTAHDQQRQIWRQFEIFVAGVFDLHRADRFEPRGNCLRDLFGVAEL
jgi:hypothetical protein